MRDYREQLAVQQVKPIKAIILLLSGLYFSLLSAEEFPSPPQELPAFPGAEGFGRFSHGGRGGEVYRVINLNDAGPGSLREAIEANGPRTIVFGVSGLIELEQPLVLRNGYCTIAGQTAPGAGICLKNYAFVVANTSHVIVRYMRFRPGDSSGKEGDSVSVVNSNQIIFDHCSMSWGTDAIFDLTKGTGLVTVQWCILSECLYDSVHSGGPHSMCAGFDGSGAGGGSYHHNLLASCVNRMPRIDGFGDALVDLRNNVIYNWGGGSSYGGEKARMNFIGNYFKHGPATPDKNKYVIFSAGSTESRLYLGDNFVDGSSEATSNPWDAPRTVLYRPGVSIETLKADQPFEVAPVTTHSAPDAYGLVLQHAGASLRRDAVDTRLVDEVERKTAMGGNSFGENTGIIDSPTEVGGWPEYVSEEAPADSDGDGMPNHWELKMGLNPEDPEDGKTDADGDGYTNLEEYLNDIGLAAYYSFDDALDAGRDDSGNGNDATAMSGTWTAGGVSGGAIEFTPNQQVVIPRSIGGATGSFSIAFWVKTTQTGGTGQWYRGVGLLDAEVGGVTGDFGTVLSGSKLGFGVGQSDTTITSTTDINDGVWHHVVATRNGNSGQMEIYVDGGQPEASANGPAGARTAPSQIVMGSLQTNLNYFDGILDEVRLYDRVLSQSEVQSLFDAPRNSATSLQSWAESFGLAGDSLLPTADDDGDQISLLEEYAYNLNPTLRDADVLNPGTGVSGLPLIRLVDTGAGVKLRTEFIRRRTDPNLVYSAEYGGNLSDNPPDGFSSAAADPEVRSTIDENWERVIVDDSESTATSPKRFGRVKLEYSGPAP